MNNMNFQSLIQSMGGMQGVMQRLNSAFQKNGQTLNKNYILDSVRGKSYSPETIEEFKGLAKKYGYSDTDIDRTLREVGIIK